MSNRTLNKPITYVLRPMSYVLVPTSPYIRARRRNSYRDTRGDTNRRNQAISHGGGLFTTTYLPKLPPGEEFTLNPGANPCITDSNYSKQGSLVLLDACRNEKGWHVDK